MMTDLSDGTDRKITRNQKRKHDEINHVQKVCSCTVIFKDASYLYQIGFTESLKSVYWSELIDKIHTYVYFY